MNVTIAGLTGKMAQLIAKHLLASPGVKVRGLCRTPSKLPESLTSNPRLSVFQADSNDISTIRSALKGSDAAICCYLGDAHVMVEGQKHLIDACIAERVPRYVASDWSMDFRKLELGQHPLKDPMKHVQAYLEEKEASGEIKAVHILNACFLEAPWGGLWNAQGSKLQYWGTGEEKWELTSYDNAAEFTAKAVMNPEISGWLSCKFEHFCRALLVISIEAATRPYNYFGKCADIYKQSGETRRTYGELLKISRRSTSRSRRLTDLEAWTTSMRQFTRCGPQSRVICGPGCRYSTRTTL